MAFTFKLEFVDGATAELAGVVFRDEADALERRLLGTSTVGNQVTQPA